MGLMADFGADLGAYPGLGGWYSVLGDAENWLPKSNGLGGADGVVTDECCDTAVDLDATLCVCDRNNELPFPFACLTHDEGEIDSVCTSGGEALSDNGEDGSIDAWLWKSFASCCSSVNEFEDRVDGENS